MIFNKHYNLKDKHAILSASKYHWLNYTDEKFKEYLDSYNAAQRGTELHALAADCIRLGVKLRSSKQTLNMYVNDAIGFKMEPEQVLYFSENCFGTCDAISFRNDQLRIYDLKTGKSPASMNQLYIYDALFCLEYDVRPGDISIENRIYQNNEIEAATPGASDILPVMDTIIRLNKIIEYSKER